MKTYRVSWLKGRRTGAQGKHYPDSVVVQAENEKAAHLKAYETHEHLMCVDITEIDKPRTVENNIDRQRPPLLRGAVSL